MKEIILDSSLYVTEDRYDDSRKFDPERFFNDSKGFKAITEISAETTHINYLYYLTGCWKRHYGVIVSPTILWNLVLGNLAYKVNKNPDVFRKYFTESDKKEEIIVVQGGNLISVELLIEALQGKVPSTILKDVFPVFSTDTEKSKMANYTAFLDMVSPYYNYSMLLCGIPKIKVLGTKDDWLWFMWALGKITAAIPECAEYLIAVANRIAIINEPECDYSKFFTLERCGSGSQVEVNGWITEFFIKQPRVPYPENFIPCISKIDYHCYNNGKDYRLYAGLFTSTIEDGYLVPGFESIYYEKVK